MDVSVLIPSADGYRKGNVNRLLNQLSKQTYAKFEIIIVKGIFPCSRAHNIGVDEARSSIVVFFDDDIELGNSRIIENFVKVLNDDNDIGIVGTSQLLPLNSNRFQIRCSKELYRTEFPVVTDITESDMATHAGMAIRKCVYQNVGGENEKLLLNDDLYLRFKVKEAGYRIVIAPNTWVYHPQPKKLNDLIRRQFAGGVAQAHDYKYYPSLIYYSPLSTSINTNEFPEKSSIYRQIKRNVGIIASGLRNDYLIRVVARMSGYVGFIFGWFHRKKWWYHRLKSKFDAVVPELIRYQKSGNTLQFKYKKQINREKYIT